MADSWLDESSSVLATRWTVDWLSSRRGVFVCAAALLIGGGISGYWVSQHPKWPGTVQVIVPIGCALFALLLVVAVVDANHRLRAPATQRDRARTRLHEIRDAAFSYSIVPVSLWTRPSGYLRTFVKVEIENHGRGAHFAAIIDSVEGASEQLVDPYKHLLWEGRIGVYAEEIPSGERRTVGAVALLAPVDRVGQPETLHFTHVGPDAELGPNPTTLQAGTATIWIRVSARGIPEIGYSRLIGVVIAWEGPGNPFDITLRPSSPGDEKEVHSPSFASLLDY